MTTRMRPLPGDDLRWSEARARIDAAVRPIERTERIPLADANGRVLARERRGRRRCAAVRARGNGRLRRSRPRHVGRHPRAAARACPAHRDALHRPGRATDGRTLRVHRDRHRRADAGRRRCGGYRGGHRWRGIRWRGPRVLAGLAAPARRSAGRGHPPRNSRSFRRARRLPRGRVGAAGGAWPLPSWTVYGRPRVAILSTGNEIVEPGRPLAPARDL